MFILFRISAGACSPVWFGAIACCKKRCTVPAWRTRLGRVLFGREVTRCLSSQRLATTFWTDSGGGGGRGMTTDSLGGSMHTFDVRSKYTSLFFPKHMRPSVCFRAMGGVPVTWGHASQRILACVCVLFAKPHLYRVVLARRTGTNRAGGMETSPAYRR